MSKVTVHELELRESYLAVSVVNLEPAFQKKQEKWCSEMHTVYARISALSANLSTALLVLVGLIASTTLLFNAQATGKIDVANVKV